MPVALFGMVESLVLATLILIFIISAYVWNEHKRSKLRLLQEIANRKAAFLDVLARSLRKTPPGGFDFGELIQTCGMPPDEASEVAEDFFARFARKVVSDGIITPDERRKLDHLSRILQIDANAAREIEDDAKHVRYREAVSEVLADGVVSAVEAAQLASLRNSLGVERSVSVAVASDLTRDAYIALLRRIVSVGRIDAQQKSELRRFKEGLAWTDGEAIQLIRREAADLYGLAFAMVVQDGIVTEQEESFLAWLRDETGLPEAEVRSFQARMDEVKRLSDYRSGQLPVIRTTKLLEGGESCHWDSSCRYLYRTPTRSYQVDGHLIATSKRVIFNSPTKNVSYPPWKILNISVAPQYLDLMVDARQGSGVYWVNQPDDLEAILVGLVRRTKYLAAENFSSSATRHIPGEVKREVWSRDGGRCVQCGAFGRGACLEFDHIIPHTKGGANTVANIQLLCRPCNSEKSDRI